MDKKFVCSIIVSSILLMYSCSDSDNKKEKRCLESKITIANNCDKNIVIDYFRLEGDTSLVMELFNIDGCDVSEQNTTLEPGLNIQVSVYFGSCYIDYPEHPDNCDQYISPEIITVEYDGKSKDFYLAGVDFISIDPSDFE